MDNENIDLDLSDLMAPDATPATDAPVTPEAAEAPAEQAPVEPSPAATEVERLRAENAAMKQHVDNLLGRLSQPQQQPAPKHEDALPDVAGHIAQSFDKTTAPPLAKALELLEQRLEAKMKGFVPRNEWDAAQPVIQRAVLSLDEQRAQQTLREKGVDAAQIQAAKKCADELMARGERFSSYEGAYRAGLAEAMMAEKMGKAVATKAAREVKAATAAQGSNTPADTPATKAKITVAKNEVLNDFFGTLDKIKAASTK